MDYPYYANYPTDNPSEIDNSSSSVGLKRSMMVVMTVTIRKMDADDNHDVDHDDDCFQYDEISYLDLTLFYAEKGPLAEEGLGTRLNMMTKMMTMMIMITMMMTTTMIMVMLMTTTIVLKRNNKWFCWHL